jgi:hypothetical protein
MIEINLKPGGGTLKVKLAMDPMPDQTAVLMVPAFAASTGPVLMPSARLPGSNDNLDVELPNLAPGDYVVYTFSHFEDIEFRNPAFLQSLSGGVNVKIEDGRTAEITLRRVVK